VLWYNVSGGYDYYYYYYNRQSSYTPLFNVTATSDQQLQQARRICTVNAVLDSACVYDYYSTGNSFASNVTATTAHYFSAVHSMLGKHDYHVRSSDHHEN